jgi:hypothetical protein
VLDLQDATSGISAWATEWRFITPGGSQSSWSNASTIDIPYSDGTGVYTVELDVFDNAGNEADYSFPATIQ